MYGFTLLFIPIIDRVNTGPWNPWKPWNETWKFVIFWGKTLETFKFYFPWFTSLVNVFTVNLLMILEILIFKSLIAFFGALKSHKAKKPWKWLKKSLEITLKLWKCEIFGIHPDWGSYLPYKGGLLVCQFSHWNRKTVWL